MTPRITIVTATLNCAAPLGVTASSIRDQTYRNVQWIVADAESVDETASVARANADIVSNWICGPDTGIYDAWNKACRAIDGEWIIFLGAGDYFDSGDSLEQAAQALSKLPPSIELAYGVLVAHPKSGPAMRFERPWNEISRSLYSRMTMPHSATFHRADLLKARDPFNAKFKIAGDYDLVLGSIVKGKVPEYLGDRIVVHTPSGGISENPANRLRVFREFSAVRRIHNISVGSTAHYYYFLRAILRTILARFTKR